MCLAQLELYRSVPDIKLLDQTKKALDFLLSENGLLLAGQSGLSEAWNSSQEGEGMVGETCATAYAIRLYENLFRLTGNSFYGDLIERALYNALFAAQAPDGSKCRYYTPLEGKRYYFEGQGYCCPNNYRRIVSELPEMIYYKYREKGVAINLYTQSAVDMEIGEGLSVSITQKTTYPNEGRVSLVLSPSKSAEFPVFLRIPSWCDSPRITVNGIEMKSLPQKGSMCKIIRRWSPNDEIVLNFPMNIRLIKGRKRQDGRVALLRGPVVFGLSESRNQHVLTLHTNNHVNGEKVDLGRLTLDPGSLTEIKRDSLTRPDGLSFKLKGWKEGYATIIDPHDIEVTFTEYADPTSNATYFRVFNMKEAVEDELYKTIFDNLWLR